MKIYFNSVGAEISRDTTDDNYVYGNDNVNIIQAYWQDRVLTQYIKTITFERPDGTRTNELVMTNSVYGDYAIFKVGKSIINQAGTFKITIKLKKANQQAVSGYDTACTSLFNIVVAEGVAPSDETISTDQYESLLQAITNESNTRANADAGIRGTAADYESLDVNYNNRTNKIKVGIGYIDDPDDKSESEVELPVATEGIDGLMSKEDKQYINDIQNGSSSVNTDSVWASDIHASNEMSSFIFEAQIIRNSGLTNNTFNGNNTNNGTIEGGKYKNSQLVNPDLVNAVISQQNTTPDGVAKLKNINDAKEELQLEIDAALQEAKRYHDTDKLTHIVNGRVEFDETNYILRFYLNEASGVEKLIGSVDLPIESLVLNVENIGAGRIKITYKNGNSVIIDVYDLVSGFATDEDFANLRSEWETYKTNMNTAEGIRIQAENERISNENDRVIAENERQTAENARVSNENERKDNELERIRDSEIRSTQFDTLKANMQNAISTFNTNGANAINTFNSNGNNAINEWQERADATLDSTLISKKEILALWGEL